MKPKSHVKDGYLHASLWLIVDRNGTVRMTRGEPDLNRNERAVAVTLKLPVSLWSTPRLTATLTVDNPAPGEATVDVQAANSALKEALGVDIDLIVRAPEHG